jgi:type II secretory pathway pseudopilin PulG
MLDANQYRKQNVGFGLRAGARRAAGARSQEGGYALLFVLFLTAVLAVTLARALPQIAMQSQRVREERLIYRGEQYKRAIQLYFRKFKKYPSSIDDLEETNNERFLRRRYKDPITGKDEWRLVHMGSDGRFSDSLVYDQEKEETEKADTGGGIQPSAPIGSAAAQAMPEGFATPDGRFRGAARARAVRRSAAPELPGQGPPSPAYFTQGAAGDPAQQVDPNDPFAVAGTGAPGQEGQPTQPQPGQYPAYSRTRPENVPPPAPQQAQIGFGNPAQQAPNQPATPQYRIGNPQPATTGRGQPQPQPPMSPGAFGMAGAGNPAAQLISNLLTRPRPGGLSGIMAAQQGGGQQQSAFAGGIAGVASEAEDRGVKVYQGFEQYNQWEFVYDYRQDASFGGQNVGPQAAAASGGQALPQGQPGLSNSGALNINPANIPGLPGAAGNPYQQGYPTVGGPGATPNAPADPTAQPPGQPDIDPVTGLPRQQPVDPNNPGAEQPNTNDPYAAPPIPGDPNAQQPQPGQPGLQAFPPGAFPFPGQPGYQPQQQPNQQQRRR